MLSEQPSASTTQILLIRISFALGLVLGILAVVAWQQLSPKNGHSIQSVAHGEVEQTSSNSTNRISTIDKIDVGQFQEIFNHVSISEQYSVLYATLSQATEQELKDWWLLCVEWGVESEFNTATLSRTPHVCLRVLLPDSLGTHPSRSDRREKSSTPLRVCPFDKCVLGSRSRTSSESKLRDLHSLYNKNGFEIESVSIDDNFHDWEQAFRRTGSTMVRRWWDGRMGRRNIKGLWSSVRS